MTNPKDTPSQRAKEIDDLYWRWIKSYTGRGSIPGESERLSLSAAIIAKAHQGSERPEDWNDKQVVDCQTGDGGQFACDDQPSESMTERAEEWVNRVIDGRREDLIEIFLDFLSAMRPQGDKTSFHCHDCGKQVILCRILEKTSRHSITCSDCYDTPAPPTPELGTWECSTCGNTIYYDPEREEWICDNCRNKTPEGEERSSEPAPTWWCPSCNKPSKVDCSSNEDKAEACTVCGAELKKAEPQCTGEGTREQCPVCNPPTTPESDESKLVNGVVTTLARWLLGRTLSKHRAPSDELVEVEKAKVREFIAPLVSELQSETKWAKHYCDEMQKEQKANADLKREVEGLKKKSHMLFIECEKVAKDNADLTSRIVIAEGRLDEIHMIPVNQQCEHCCTIDGILKKDPDDIEATIKEVK